MAINEAKIILSAEDRTRAAVASAKAGLLSLQQGAARLSSSLGLIGGGLSIVAFGSFIKASIDAADKLNDLSKSTGVSVEQLAGLQLAAKQSGTDLEGVAQAINKLSVNIGKDGEKFAKLGITAKEPLEAFKQLADVFVAIKDPQERAAVAAAALGKSWASAAPLLAEGGKAIGEMVEKGTKLSGITRQIAADADKFNDQLEELKTIAGQAGRSIGSELIPFISSAIKEFQLGVKHAGSFGNAVLVLGTINPFRNAQQNIRAYTDDLAKLEKDRPAGIGNTFGNVIEQEIARTDAAISKKKTQIAFLKEAAQEEALLLGKGFEKYKIPVVPEKPGKKPNTKGFLDSKTGNTDKRLEFIKSLRREVELLGATDGGKRLFDAERLGITGQSLATVRSLSTRLDEYKNSLEAAKIANQEFDESFADNEKHIEAIESLIGAFRKQNEQIAAEADLIGATNVERETAVRLRELELVGLSKYSAEWEKAGAAIKKASETSRLSTLIGDADFSKLKQDQEDMVLLAKAFTDGIEQSDGSLKKLAESEYLDAVIKRLGLVGDKAQNTKSIFEDLGITFTSAFEDAIVAGGNFSDILKGLEKDIVRIITRYATEDIFSSLFPKEGSKPTNNIGGAIDQIKNSDFFSSIASFFNFADGGIMTAAGPMQLKSYAMGGVANSPQFARFGEGSMAEAFVPLPDGRNIPVKMQGGGGATQIIINISTPDANSFRASQGQITAEMSRALRSARRNL